jgi:hypothetical protein
MVRLYSSKAALQQQPPLHLICTTALGLPNNDIRPVLERLSNIHLPPTLDLSDLSVAVVRHLFIMNLTLMTVEDNVANAAELSRE